MKASTDTRIGLRPGETLDEFMEGRLRLIQSRRGYRFSSDAVLLARFVSTRAGDLVVDLGTGCGIIPLVLLLTRPIRHALGLEIQPELAGQAFRNARLNGLSHKMTVIRGDLRYPPIVPFSADVVVCNPPYRPKTTGRVSPDLERAIARHEIFASLDDILDAARKLLKAGGRLAVIYAAVRLVDLLIRMRGFGLEPKRVMHIHPRPESDAKLVLVEATSGGRRGVKILPPLTEQGRTSF
ncbi:MAG: methyltransferase [Thermodesulfobacteriota bacterium]